MNCVFPHSELILRDGNCSRGSTIDEVSGVNENAQMISEYVDVTIALLPSAQWDLYTWLVYVGLKTPVM